MAKETIYDKDQQQLVKDLGNRNAKAFEHLFVTRYKGLCRFAHAFVDSYEEAEEVVQDMFARIWEKGLQLNASVSLDNYLCVSVRNACLRKVEREARLVDLEAARTVEYEETKERDMTPVWKAVDELPEQCRVILKLVVLEDMKYSEVAEKLGVSVNTVKTQIKIAYRILRSKLSKEQLTLLFLRF